MKSSHIIIRGEQYITLQNVAQCYQMEVHWLEEVYEAGLLGPGEHVGGSLAVMATMLDRVARIERLRRYQGLDIHGIALWLDSTGQ